MAERIVIEVDRDDLTGGMQLSISALDEKGYGDGYRLHGPTYVGQSTHLISHTLDQRDVKEIRSYLNRFESGDSDDD